MTFNATIINTRAEEMINKGLRIGQSIFNAVYEYYPQVDILKNTEYDCFYDDSKIDSFIEKTKELIKNG
jgi:hypothetical protein